MISSRVYSIISTSRADVQPLGHGIFTKQALGSNDYLTIHHLVRVFTQDQYVGIVPRIDPRFERTSHAYGFFQATFPDFIQHGVLSRQNRNVRTERSKLVEFHGVRASNSFPRP